MKARTEKKRIKSEKEKIMTVTPMRKIEMGSPSVTSASKNQMKTITSRVSNFSVASLLADTRSKTPPPSRIIANHLNNNNNNELTPKNLSTTHVGSCSPSSQNNESTTHSIKHNDSELLDQRSHTPHSSIASDDYDDSIHDDEDDEDVDIEDCENSTNGHHQKSSGLMPPQSMISGAHPIRPTPFSALAAAAAAWGGMNNGVGGWPGRQMQPFGPPGMFPGQGFPGQMNGGKNRNILKQKKLKNQKN